VVVDLVGIRQFEVEEAAGLADMTKFTRPVSFLGLPALSLPVAKSRSGLPISMQLVGRPFDEATVLFVDHVYEAALQWSAWRYEGAVTAG
jgi:aspartyl-tRNA(Asn)/glutamyl-tRNA(Gln) amidotransferase subunit A